MKINPMYIIWALVGVFFVAYSVLIYEELVPLISMKSLCAGTLTLAGMVMILAAIVFNDKERAERGEDQEQDR